MGNLNIPSKSELYEIVLDEKVIGHREEKQRGTNCSGEIINYINNKGENIRLFVKKSFLKMSIEKFESDYKKIKSKFKNIIPNRGFVGNGGNIFAFCVPIRVKIDIFGKENLEYLIEVIKNNPKLLKQLKFFIKCYEDFLLEGLNLDLYGEENLVISDDNKLYYLDSFLVFHESSIIREGSLENLLLLKKIVNEIENNKN